MLEVDSQLAQNARMTNSDCIKPDSNGYFITGSDTDVGKTYIACQLVEQLRSNYARPVSPSKPASRPNRAVCLAPAASC
jgi:hypothetical protein